MSYNLMDTREIKAWERGVDDGVTYRKGPGMSQAAQEWVKAPGSTAKAWGPSC